MNNFKVGDKVCVKTDYTNEYMNPNSSQYNKENSFLTHHGQHPFYTISSISDCGNFIRFNDYDNGWSKIVFELYKETFDEELFHV